MEIPELSKNDKAVSEFMQEIVINKFLTNLVKQRIMKTKNYEYAVEKLKNKEIVPVTLIDSDPVTLIDSDGDSQSLHDLELMWYPVDKALQKKMFSQAKEALGGIEESEDLKAAVALHTEITDIINAENLQKKLLIDDTFVMLAFSIEEESLTSATFVVKFDIFDAAEVLAEKYILEKLEEIRTEESEA